MTINRMGTRVRCTGGLGAACVRGGCVVGLGLAFASCVATPRREVAATLAQSTGRISVALSDESGQHEWDLRGNEPFVAGDAVSLFVLLELLHRVDSGELDLEEPVAVPAPASTPYAERGAVRGILSSLRSVKTLSMRDVAVLMMAEGDVVAVNLAIDRLGLESVASRATKCGATRTLIQRRPGVAAPPENYTCARDVVAAWKALTVGPTLSAELREQAADILRASRTGRKAAAGSLGSADVRISYDGDSPGSSAVVHASGSIYMPEGPLMFAVLGEDMESTRSGEDLLADVARIVHGYYRDASRAAARKSRDPSPRRVVDPAPAEERPADVRRASVSR